MCRTAEPFARQRGTFFPFILLMIAICLGAHFLLEDIIFCCTMDGGSQSCSTAGTVCDEMDHQDDLLMVENPPEDILHNPPRSMHALNFCLERQFTFPIRIPPRITYPLPTGYRLG